MKNCKDTKMIRAYNTLLLQLKWANIVPKKHVLNNEVSENMKNHIRGMCKLDMELVSPGCHRRNTAKVAIRNFIAHFLCILVGNVGVGCRHQGAKNVKSADMSVICWHNIWQHWPFSPFWGAGNVVSFLSVANIQHVHT
jgi:hypothetical protein